MLGCDYPLSIKLYYVNSLGSKLTGLICNRIYRKFSMRRGSHLFSYLFRELLLELYQRIQAILCIEGSHSTFRHLCIVFGVSGCFNLPEIKTEIQMILSEEGTYIFRYLFGGRGLFIFLVTRTCIVTDNSDNFLKKPPPFFGGGRAVQIHLNYT